LSTISKTIVLIFLFLISSRLKENEFSVLPLLPGISSCALVIRFIKKKTNKNLYINVVV